MDLPKPKHAPPASMQYLQAPGMRGLRSPSRESIASDFSCLSVSSRLGGPGLEGRRKRMAYLSKSRETINSNAACYGGDQLSLLNVSVDVPSLQASLRRNGGGNNDDFSAQPNGVAGCFVRPHQPMTRSFSFADMRSVPLQLMDQDGVDALLLRSAEAAPAAVSDPSLSVNSDFDDEISMFFDDKGEPINFCDRAAGGGERIAAAAGAVGGGDEVEHDLLGNGVGDEGLTLAGENLKFSRIFFPIHCFCKSFFRRQPK